MAQSQKSKTSSLNSVCKGCVEWVDEPPFNEDAAKGKAVKLRDERNSFAIIRRRQAHGGEQGWKTYSITINSLHIKSILPVLFDTYPAVDANEPEFVMKYPFTPFPHRWERLLQMELTEENPTVKEHLTLLREMLQPELEQSFAILLSFKMTGYLKWEDLDLAFVPGEIVVAVSGGNMSAGLLRSCSKGEVKVHFKVAVLDWSGERFGAETRYFGISKFEGMRQVNTLETFPLVGHPDEEDIRKSLVARGRIFESLAGQHFKFYPGSCVEHESNPMPWSSGSKLKAIHERVMIDTYGYYRLQSCPIPELESPATLSTDDAQKPCNTQLESVNGIRGDTSDGDVAGKDKKPTTTLTDEQCLFAWPLVKGFAMISKSWIDLDVSKVKDVDWIDGAVDKLILDEEEKQLRLALMMMHNHDSSAGFDDFIPGKGKGIVILLAGPPGVGKTLTAESISEHLKQPLYRLDTSDLGTSVYTVESKLKTVLECCSRWGAVLLLDKADVFLEERPTDSLARNELVVTFLRLLEYYEGIMILTTNRNTAIDAAFESRIDITLVYKDLDEPSRAQIWRNVVRSLGSKATVSDETFEELAKHPFNGRQIKSAIKTGCIMAAYEQRPLEIRHLRVIVNLRLKTAKALSQADKLDSIELVYAKASSSSLNA
ncbi:P-loop containing nucleoside triphosphate hydrolase protein [Podospora didyma]|uniref:P-loop containing nucleoside triphosphate hydrolase protein n=1 Tax=Podospora didyma TaxID=330526 RepID=A0AAE0U3T0_9PEZI|nr:P-loop containing nucleoside triphosphate hydrolase protein [Podospora didyma]